MIYKLFYLHNEIKGYSYMRIWDSANNKNYYLSGAESGASFLNFMKKSGFERDELVINYIKHYRLQPSNALDGVTIIETFGEQNSANI